MRIGVAVATGLFVASIFVGFAMAPFLGADIMSQMKEFVAPLKGRDMADILAFIFLNNAIKALMAMLLGVLLGLPTLFFVSTNGITIGVLAATVGESLGYGKVAAALLPHGILELPALLLAAGLGFALASEALKWVMKRRSEVRVTLKRGLKLYGIAVVPTLAVAALIEVFVTPVVVMVVSG